MGTLEVGQQLGDYEILGKIGAGGMGTVYKARNVISQRVEAIKVSVENYWAENAC